MYCPSPGSPSRLYSRRHPSMFFSDPGFHARPEHLQDFSVRGVVIYDGIAGPVAVVLVDFAFLDLGIGEGGFRMADVGAAWLVAFAEGLCRLHVVGQPYQVVVALLSGGDRRPFLDHQAVAREAATAPGAGLAVHHAVETVVERPEDMAAGSAVVSTPSPPFQPSVRVKRASYFLSL